MQVSAEIRWFWRGKNSELKDWFCSAHPNGFAAGGGRERVDAYLLDPAQAELGIKRRGTKKGFEIKGLVSAGRFDLAEGEFSGKVEIWTKWTSTVLIPDHSVSFYSLTKRRWLRKFSTDTGSPIEIELGQDEMPVKGTIPNRGCSAELTFIESGDAGSDWCTLGFESFGDLSSVEVDLRSVASVVAARNPPAFKKNMALGYPAWIQALQKTT